MLNIYLPIRVNICLVLFIIFYFNLILSIITSYYQVIYINPIKFVIVAPSAIFERTILMNSIVIILLSFKKCDITLLALRKL